MEKEFCWLSRKGVYPYEYMDSWQRFYEKSLSDKDIYSSLILDIMDGNYKYEKRV